MKQQVVGSHYLKIIIIVLSVLLVLSAAGLVARYVYVYYSTQAKTTVAVPDNLIKIPQDIDSSQSTDAGSQNSPVLESNLNADAYAVYGDTSRDTLHNADSSKSTGDDSKGAAIPESDPASVLSDNIYSGNSSLSYYKTITALQLQLHKGHAGDNEKFSAKNMLPGDSVSSYFCVKTYHNKPLTLLFRTDVTEETNHLSDVLNIRVTSMEDGTVLIDAPIAGVNHQEFGRRIVQNLNNESTAYYKIDVYMDTSVGNEHQMSELKAVFNWYIYDTGTDTNTVSSKKNSGATRPVDKDIVREPPKEVPQEIPPEDIIDDTSGLLNPNTGDRIDISLWIILAAVSFSMIIVLVFSRRKEDTRHE